MHTLIEQWRREAEEFTDENYHSEAALLWEKADELEQHWHDDYHGPAKVPELCAICRRGMGGQ